MNLRFAFLAVLLCTIPMMASALDCSRGPGTLPDETLPAGTVDIKNPIKHIIIIMQENRSFDHYFGQLTQFGYGSAVDGIRPGHVYHDQNGNVVEPFRLENYCIPEPPHSWDSMHLNWNQGNNDQFISPSAMRYYEEKDLDYYYALANHFAIGDRYFSSVLSPTFPNRLFFMAATSFGNTANKIPKSSLVGSNTIFDLLSKHKISWRYYFGDVPAMGIFPNKLLKYFSHLAPLSLFPLAVHSDNLPSVIFLDPSMLFANEEPPKNFQIGERSVYRQVHALMNSKHWNDSVLFMVYDEAGGFFDHVAPPEACEPDEIAPILKPGQVQAKFDRYGFRVPFIAISPYVKHHYVSHVVYDHTSILRFIENKFNLPALTKRDANADGMMDLFDFENPQFEIPNFPKPNLDAHQYKQCLASTFHH